MDHSGNSSLQLNNFTDKLDVPDINQYPDEYELKPKKLEIKKSASFT